MKTYEELKDFLKSKTKLRMSHIYKPVFLLTLLQNKGHATKQDIAESFALRDSDLVKHYKANVVHQMPGKRLIRDGLVEKTKDGYKLAEAFDDLTDSQLAEVKEILESRVLDYMEMRNPFGDTNLDAVPGSLRFEVLREAGGRCELCGVSSREKQIDVDHIVPRSKGGGNHKSNLQALCRTCNAQKKDRDDTDFKNVHEAYNKRSEDCIFCTFEKTGERQILHKGVALENELAIAFYDGFAVTKGHTLFIPRRHVSDYFDLNQAELNAINSLIRIQKQHLESEDSSISGWNVGVNVNESGGQSVFHVHVHLIPRRDGDMDDPKGGVRGVIPEKQKY